MGGGAAELHGRCTDNAHACRSLGVAGRGVNIVAKPKNRFTRYPLWNTKMYPIWKEGDSRYKDSWKGGRATLNIGNDSPTLTGAKVTFTIDLQFPHNQKLQPNGDVVWAEDCTVNGIKYHQSELVYPVPNTEWEAVFPDGTSMKEDKNPRYVFVWKTRGQYWQVAGCPSSSLTIATDDIPLGSYTMDIVIYHYRSKEKFIPLGYGSTQFSITDQIPFVVSLDQVNGILATDTHFIQNKAIAFTITLHDPSAYLNNADITFNWDFGDESGALISRELTVTHTYISAGAFKPHVVIQAVIPDKACDCPVDDPTQALGPHVDLSPTVKVPTLVSAAVPLLISTDTPGLTVNMLPSDAEEDNAEDEVSTTQLEDVTAKSPPKFNAGTSTKGTLTLTGQTAVAVLSKRDADDKPADDDCVIYRYGSFCTGIEVAVETIEKLEIIQIDNEVMSTPDAVRNVLDLTVTCSGSVPKEVCSVVLDAECLRPIHTACNMVEPSEECRLVLRHFFQDSGIYCINVSVSNDVSFAVTSAKVQVNMGSALVSSGTVTMVMGLLVLVTAAAVVAYSYKRFKTDHPLKDAVFHHTYIMKSIFSNLLKCQRVPVDNRPLLQDKPL
ncbi:melanocyte protein PMEL-like [Thalassophryne amazonica]|uniref:melanocyte protein PMEL-like n=1 Tax=Thalassophryne amazonica TaxID=390379 RepID=UPI0014713AD5|nr:melanocyte protein PMEL-like [Thalassophryne amazonica]